MHTVPTTLFKFMILFMNFLNPNNNNLLSNVRCRRIRSQEKENCSDSLNNQIKIKQNMLLFHPAWRPLFDQFLKSTSLFLYFTPDEKKILQNSSQIETNTTRKFIRYFPLYSERFSLSAITKTLIVLKLHSLHQCVKVIIKILFLSALDIVTVHYMETTFAIYMPVCSKLHSLRGFVQLKPANVPTKTRHHRNERCQSTPHVTVSLLELIQ